MPQAAQSFHKLSESELNSLRLCPEDGVLEYRLSDTQGSMVRWVPVVPAVQLPPDLSEEPVSWRKWLFDQCHSGLLQAHRPQDQTFHLLRRTAYWSSLARDCARWCSECEACIQFRSTRLATGPLKSMLGSSEQILKLPWQEVIID